MRNALLLLFFPFALTANPPACDVDSAGQISLLGNAGCLVKIQSKLLMVRHRFGGKWGIPGGGSEKGESAQCTAHRETWEETGLDVQVGKLLKKLDNGFALFLCKTKSAPKVAGDKIDLPYWSKVEITEIRLKDPATISEKDYRFPEQLKDVQKFFSML